MSPSIAFTLTVACICGLAARRKRLPGGALVGALVGAAAAQLVTGSGESLPGGFRVAAQIGIGATIGARFRPGVLDGVGGLVARATPMLLTTISAALGLGLVFAHVAALSPEVGMLSTIPGGSGDVIAVALDLGDDAAFIATVHLGRQILVYVSLGVLFRLAQAASSPPEDDPWRDGRSG
jgi:uncharacterized protein